MYDESKMKYGINYFKIINISFLQTSGSKLCRLHQRLLKSTKEATISLRHLRNQYYP